MVASTVQLYNNIRSELLPTPSKSHYTFNLRDLSKVIQGVMRADVKSTGAPAHVQALWLHECSRVFEDRLTSADDHAWFKGQQSDLLQSSMGANIKEVVTTERLIFGDFMVPGARIRLCVSFTGYHLTTFNLPNRCNCLHPPSPLQLPLLPPLPARATLSQVPTPACTSRFRT